MSASVDVFLLFLIRFPLSKTESSLEETEQSGSAGRGAELSIVFKSSLVSPTDSSAFFFLTAVFFFGFSLTAFFEDSS